MNVMKKILAITMTMALLLSVFPVGGFQVLAVEAFEEAEPPAAWGPTPSKAQLAYHKEEMSAFIHFGMNTFTNKEWGDGTESPTQFTLSSIDADQWVKTFKDAGFGRLILVTKHHDGFCNWPSELTEHSVKNSPGKIDVVGAVSAAVTKYDMGMGIYVSPWDQNCVHYGEGRGSMDYNDFYMGQLRELLGNPKYGNNGKFVEVWMDGAKGSGVTQPYYFTSAYVEEGKDNWRDVIKGFDPDIVLFAPFGDEVRWNGTESGMSGVPCWNRINWADQKSYFDARGGENVSLVTNGQANGVNWSVPEADFSLVNGWFAHSGTPKTLKQLGDIYFASVGRSSILLMNAAPGQNGKISDAQVNRITEFGETVRKTFETDLALGSAASASAVRGGVESIKYAPANVLDGDYDTYWTMDDGQTTGSITIDLGENKTFDVVSLQEYIPLGQRISSYSVETYSNGNWLSFGGGQTIGYKGLVRGLMTTASRVRVNISASQAVPVINAIGVYKTAVDDWALPLPTNISLTTLKPASGSVGYGDYPPSNAVDGNESTRWASQGNAQAQPWLEIDLLQPTRFNRFYISQLGTRITEFQIQYRDNTSDPWQTAFSGVQGNPSWTRGASNNYYNASANFPTVTGRYVRLFVSRQTQETSIWTFDLYYDGAQDETLYSLDKTEYHVADDVGTLDITVKRSQITEGASIVNVYTEPGTGVHGKVYNHISRDIVFEGEELEKTISVEILDILDGEAMKNFSVKLSAIEGDKGVITSESGSKVCVWSTTYDHEVSREYARVRLPASGSKMMFCHNWDYAYPAERQSSAAATDGYVVGWLGYTSRGDGRIRLWYNAAAAGDYGVNVRYQTGRAVNNPNLMKWQGPNVISDEAFMPRLDTSTQWFNADLVITINEAGPGYIEFYNDVPGSGVGTEMPNLDYMTFTRLPEKSKITNYTANLTAGFTANIFVETDGTDAELTAEIVVDEIAYAASFNGNVSAIISVPVQISAGEYTLKLIVDGVMQDSKVIKVNPMPDTLWNAVISTSGDDLLVRFAAPVTPVAKGYNVRVNGNAVPFTAEGDSALKFRNTTALGANTIVASGLKFEAFFPSYSFTFSMAYNN